MSTPEHVSKQAQPHDDTSESVKQAREKFVAAIVAAARTRDALASERDKAANARDVAAVLDETLRGDQDARAEVARKFAAQDRYAAREDRTAAAQDLADLTED